MQKIRKDKKKQIKEFFFSIKDIYERIRTTINLVSTSTPKLADLHKDLRESK